MQTNRTPRSKGRVDWVSKKGTCRLYALPKVETRTALMAFCRVPAPYRPLTPGQVLDQIVEHAKRTGFMPVPVQ